MSENKRIIEINGIKMEVDLSTAKTIDIFRVGDPVKILLKEYGKHTVLPGVIISFNDFHQKPTINVAYLNHSYSSAEIKTAAINADSEDIEIVRAYEGDFVIPSDNIVEAMDKKILSLQSEIDQLNYKRRFFIDNFNKFFNQEVGK